MFHARERPRSLLHLKAICMCEGPSTLTSTASPFRASARRRLVAGQVWRRRVEPHVAPHNIGEGKNAGVLEVARRPRLVVRPASRDPAPARVLATATRPGESPRGPLSREISRSRETCCSARRLGRAAVNAGAAQAATSRPAKTLKHTRLFGGRGHGGVSVRIRPARIPTSALDGVRQRNAAPDPAEERHRDAEERWRDLDPDDERHRPQRCHEQPEHCRAGRVGRAYVKQRPESTHQAPEGEAVLIGADKGRRRQIKHQRRGHATRVPSHRREEGEDRAERRVRERRREDGARRPTERLEGLRRRAGAAPASTAPASAAAPWRHRATVAE